MSSKATVKLFLVIAIVLIPALHYATQQNAIRARIDLVLVPASVRNASGKLVSDLTREDFSIYEDGRPQQITNFSTEPSALSAAIVVDTEIRGTSLRRFANSIVSLSSAFAEADEAEVYRFGHFATQVSGFTSSRDALERDLAVFQGIAEHRRDPSSSPWLLFPGRGPEALRAVLDKGAGSRVLNDALFAAGTDLATRPTDRRRIILVLSDGQVAGVTLHSFKETSDYLARNQVQVYGVTVGMAVLEGVNSIVNIYADATGGDVYRARSQAAMEAALSNITEQARYQYVLAYVSDQEPVPWQLPVVRNIEVKTQRPGVTVHYRKSYVQMPTTR